MSVCLSFICSCLPLSFVQMENRKATRELEPALADQFVSGRMYACISSRPGQSGRCDGYILEGKELEFYAKKLSHKKKATKA